MANNIKGITVEIEGETTGLSKALSGVNKQSRDLQGELREVDRLLKLDPKNTELLSQKQKILAESISTTKSKLETLKEAEKQALEQFKEGKISEEQLRAIQREVIKTEESVKSFEKQAKEFGSVFSQQIKNAGKSMEEFGGKVESAGKAFAPVSAVAAAGLAGMTAAAVKAGQSADDFNTLAKQTGLTTEEIQKFQYATDLIDVSLDTLTGSMAKLIKNMATAKKGSGDAKAAFDTLGVSITDSVTGQLRNNQDVFNDAIIALGKVSNETERDALAMAIFGKSAQDLNPLILGGADALKELGKQAENSGVILSQDTLDAANEFNDALDTLKATSKGAFSAIGSEIAASFLPVLNEIMPVINDIIKNILAWVKSLDDGQLRIIAGILAIVAGITPLLIAIGKMSIGIGALLQYAPKIVSGFSSVARLLSGGLTAAINGVSSAFAFLAANPIVLVIAALAALTVGIIYLWNTNEDFKNALIAAWNAIKDAILSFDKWITEIFTKDWSKSFGFLGDIMNSFLATGKGWYEGVKKIFSGLITFVTGAFSGDWGKAWQGVVDIFKGVFETISTVAKAPINAVIGALNSAIDGLNILIKGLNKLKIDIPKWVPGFGGKTFGMNIPEIGKIPFLANGVILSSGSAIVGDAGKELLTMINGKAQVTPLTSGARQAALAGAGTTNNYYYATIDAKNVREFNDVVKIMQTSRQTRRQF